MALIAYNRFLGEIPQSRPHLLPPTHAQKAINCDFGSGSLNPLKGGYALSASGMLNNPVLGIYTQDGINFYTWSTRTTAFRSPVIDDSFYRVYFHQAGFPFRVTTRPLNATNGPSPAASNVFKAGVPRPTSAPGLALVDRTTLRDHPNAVASAEAWYDYAGKTYGRTSVSLSAATPWKIFNFTAPGRPSGTPGDATLVVRLIFRDGSTDLVTATVREGTPTRSTSLPGGLEINLTTSSSTGTITVSWGVVETRAYTYTCFNTWEEEGATAPPALIDVTYMHDVKIVVAQPDFTGYRPFSGFRVYRTYGSSTSYIETTVGGVAPNLLDSTGGTASIGKALESTNWTPPPASLMGVELAANGWFAGYADNTLWMSEPYRPHAWPYNMTFPSTIKGVKASAQALVVTTLDGVYLVAGAHPSAAQQVKLPLPQGGISQLSMTAIDGGVAYASPDGIVIVQGTNATLAMSQRLFRREDWQREFGAALRAGDLIFGYHDGCLIGTSRSMNKGFSIRMDEEAGAYTQLNQGYSAMFFLPVADSLYYAIGSDIFQFRGGSDLSMDWWSRDWIYKSHVTFGAGFIRCDGPVDIKIFADDAQVYTNTLSSTGHFRLPPMPKALRWSIRLSGQFEVQEIALGQTMGELKNV